ncbi:MAG: glycosyltransferase family 4 protein [Candidatus Yanofskybacteria bacterium]|nr:glycosyltransferase family 4 protein [Candidatus Yanofskybacteria bacterium]
MRLVYLTSKSYPSATADGLFVAEAARAASRLLGEKFAFVVARNREPERFSGVRVLETGIIGGSFRTIRSFFTFPMLFRYLGRDAVVYSNEQPLVLVALLWRPLFGYRVVYEAHGFFHWRRDRVFLRIWRWFADRIIATSESLRSLMVRLEPKLAGRIHVVRGGFDPEVVLTNTDDRAAVRESLGLETDDFVVAYAGHFKTCGEKGLHTLLSAVHRHSDARVRALLIGGRPDEIAEYRAAFPGDRCVFREWTSDRAAVMRCLQASDAVVIPTSHDTLYSRYSFPMKAYDYLALGKPTIVSSVPIIREIMTDEVAVACAMGDERDLLRAIGDLAGDPIRAEKLGAAARAVARRYTWDERAAAIVAAVSV